MSATKRKGTTSRGRFAEARVNLWVSSLLFAAIVGMVNYLAFRHYERWDWTSQDLYTLSERSLEVLRGLSRKVDVYVFMSEADRNFRDVKELLERYEAESNRIEVSYIDPDRSPSRYKTLLQRFGVRAAVAKSGKMVADVAAVIAAGERHWRITRDDLFQLDFKSLDQKSGPKVNVKSERAITGGIIEVTQGSPTKVCVTEGHGEWGLEGRGKRSLHGLQQELRRDNVKLERIKTLGQSEVPRGCDAVYVIGPVRAFNDQEANLLVDYVRSGGRLLLAIDPLFQQDNLQSTGLEDVANEFGIRIPRSVVLERAKAQQLGRSPIEPFVVTRYGEHAITSSLKAMGGRTVVQLARAVEPMESEGAKALMRTSAQGFGETDPANLNPNEQLAPDESDIEGPVVLAAAVELPRGKGQGSRGAKDAKRPGRIVVMGDSDWLMSAFFAPQFGNSVLASSVTGWLTEREALISIPPRKIDAAAITMTRGDLQGLLFRVLVLMPAAVVLFGLAVWWARRS